MSVKSGTTSTLIAEYLNTVKDGFPKGSRIQDRKGKKGRVVYNLSAQYFIEWDDKQVEFIMKRDKELKAL